MGQHSTIEWTDATWTPIRARVKPDAREIAVQKGYQSLLPIIQPGRVGPHCERVSEGCRFCWSETNNGRCLPHNGTGLPFDRRARDLVDIFLDENILTQPLRWKKPRRIFVCSQTDLFGEFVPDEMIAQVFSVMAVCQAHVFQVLTKRADRMALWCREYGEWSVDIPDTCITIDREWEYWMSSHRPFNSPQRWPLANVHLGVSAEDQPTFDERWPYLRDTPAAVRWISYEPALGPLDISEALRMGGLEWIVIGGESGPGARPLDVEWVRSIIRQCREAGVPVFVKQLGAVPMMREDEWRTTPSWLLNPCNQTRVPSGYVPLSQNDRKGGNPLEWPEDLRVRELPEVNQKGVL